MELFSVFVLAPFFLLGTPQTILPPPPPAVISTTEAASDLHAIYITTNTITSGRIDTLLDEFSKVGGNMIVFDIQDSGGKLAYPSNLPTSIELNNRNDHIEDLSKLVKKMHDKGFQATARFVVFKNMFLTEKKPKWALKQKGTTATFDSRDGPVWLDPGNQELKDYLIDIGRELALSGVDEVQFDYVRFPDGGQVGNPAYSFTGDATMTNVQAITHFVSEAAVEIHYFSVKVSADIFGIAVWDNVSGKHIGQSVPALGVHLDAIYPMPYPSHFGPGWGGHENPADEPYYFVQETTRKFREQSTKLGGTADIRPWIQGFPMRVTNFGPQYIEDQIKGANDIGIKSYAIWNAGNNYDVSFEALR